MRLSRQRGKNFELRIARYLGATRNHFEAEDLRHPVLSIECKYRTQLPKQVLRWMAQAEAASEKGKVPAVVAGEMRQESGECLVILRLKEVRNLLGGSE